MLRSRVTFVGSVEPPVVGTSVRVGEHRGIGERREMVGRIVGTYGEEELLPARIEAVSVPG